MVAEGRGNEGVWFVLLVLMTRYEGELGLCEIDW